MEPLVYFVLGVVVLILLLVIFRGLVLWFFNIDKRTELLEEQNELLRELLNKMK